MKTKAIPWAIVLFFITLFSCKEKSPSTPCSRLLVSPAIVPSTPYFDPAWHPSGRIIGFNHLPLKEIKYAYGRDCPFPSKYTWKSDSLGFWLIDADGRNQRRVLPFYLDSPSWSPDGKWIAFVTGAQIFKMPFDGVQFDTLAMVQLTFEGRNFFPSWSPDGKKIAYQKSICSGPKSCGVWYIDLVSNTHVFVADYGNAPDWNPRNPSEMIFFTSATSKGEDIGDSLWIYNVAASNRKFLKFITLPIYESRYPKFSYDGKRVVFASSLKTGEVGLYSMLSDGSALQQLTKSTGSNNFSWGPDGRIVYLNFKYSWTDEDKGSLWIINADGSNPKPLTFNKYKISE